MRVLIDTGVLLRLLDRQDPLHYTIRTTLRAARGRGDVPVTFPQNISEFWNVSTRPASARGGYGLSPEETDRRVRLLERTLQVLPETPSAYALWRNLVVLYQVRGVQVHDARLVALMQAHAVTRLVTLNAADFSRYGSLVTVLPLNS